MDDDYHGNFDTDLFEKWFEKLCVTLTAFGSCIIHMDGASYHKRQTNPAPTSKTRKADIQEWLRSKGMAPFFLTKILKGFSHSGSYISDIAFDPKAIVAQLLMLVKEHRPSPTYKAQQIASAHGHSLLYTPPYHPELQPIELVWGRVKNAIARSPATNIASLSAKLTTEFGKMESKHWCRYYRHVQSFEDKYLALLDETVIADKDESDCTETDEEN